MRGMAIPRPRILLAILVGIGGAVAVVAGLNPLAEWWARSFEALAGPLGMSGGVGMQGTTILGLHTLHTPYYLLEAGPPDPAMLQLVAVVAGALLLVSLVLPHRFIPLRYFLRFLVLLQGISIGYFALAPAGSFPYTLPSYLAGLVSMGQVVLVLLPLILAVTYFLFDISWARKLLLMVLLLGHVAVMIPLQATVHAWLIARGSFLLLPPLFLAFGILVHVLIFVAFYGWGMSWPSPESRR